MLRSLGLRAGANFKYRVHLILSKSTSVCCPASPLTDPRSLRHALTLEIEGSLVGSLKLTAGTMCYYQVHLNIEQLLWHLLPRGLSMY